MFKKQIISRFNNAAPNYDKLCLAQKESAQLLVQTLHNNYPDFAPQTILDLGTGTGILAEKMLKFFSHAHYTLNDNAANMLKECQKKFLNLENFSYLESDMQTIPNKYYDLVVSNFSLQWVDDPSIIIKKFASNCKIFAFTYVLHGTFSQWYKILDDYNITPAPNNFLHQEQLETICTGINAKCLYFTKNYELEFANYMTFAYYLKSLGASASKHAVSISNLRKILNLNQKVKTSYKVFFWFLSFLIFLSK